MGVIMQAAYKFPNVHTVPSRFDGNRNVAWWWDRVVSQASAFRNAGFTAILLPPALKTNGGAFPVADGYGVFDVQTGFDANVHLHDYTGHAGDVWTDGGGKVTIGIPPNDNGLGYVCYSRAGLDKPNPVFRRATTQVFEGADDLDIGPAAGGKTLVIGRIWCDAGFPIDLTPQTEASHLTFSILNPTGKPLVLHNGKAQTSARGWHTLQVSSAAQGTTPFKLSVTWTATQTF